MIIPHAIAQVPTDGIAGASMVGWGVGKIVAAMSGLEAIKTFSKLNLLPMAIFTYFNFKEGGTKATIFPAAFIAAYLYLGFVA